MSELRDTNRERWDARRSICELVLGLLMLGVLTLIMVVGIDLRINKRTLFQQPDEKTGSFPVYDHFTASGGAGVLRHRPPADTVWFWMRGMVRRIREKSAAMMQRRKILIFLLCRNSKEILRQRA